MSRIVIWGGGSLGLEIATYLHDAAARSGTDMLYGILDEFEPRRLDFLRIAPSVRFFRHLHEVMEVPAVEIVIGVGEPLARFRLTSQAKNAGIRLATVAHPSAHIAPTATLEDGVVLAPFTFVGPLAVVGESALLNTYASVGHDARIGKSSTLSPYACVNGNVDLGRACFLGTGASISPRSTVGDGSKISAGSVFSGNAEPGSMIHGNPASSRVMMRVSLAG